MNRKQLLLLVGVLVVLGGAALLLHREDVESLPVPGHAASATLLGDLPVGEQLAQFSIQAGTNTLTLEKLNGVWSVKQRADYPANYGEITRTVLKLRDLKPGQTEQIGADQLARLELLPPGPAPDSGTLIEFRDTSGQLLGSLLLGKQQTRRETAPPEYGGGQEQEIPVGRWVMNPKDKTTVVLVSDPLSNLEPKPQAWLDKDFFKVQKIQSIQVRYPDAPTNSFKVSRESISSPWTMAGLTDQEELDTTKTSGFNYALSNPTFNDVVVDPDEARLGLDKPTVVRIETFDGFHYEIQVGTQRNTTLPLRATVTARFPRERQAPEDEEASVKTQKDKEFADTLKTREEKLAKEQALGKWTYEVSAWTLDSVLKKRGDLVKEKEPPTPEAPQTNAPADPVEGLMNLPGTE